MTSEDGIFELIDIIRYDLKPAYYDEAVKISADAKMYHARESEKQRARLREIRKSETADQLDQRVRLTSAATSVALGPVYSYAEQVWRTDGVTKEVDDEKIPDTIKNRIKEQLKAYREKESLHRYCFATALHYTKIDPNAWTVFEVEYATGNRGESTIKDFYPVEVMSHEVRGVGRDKAGNATFLAFEFKREVYDPNNPKDTTDVSDFYLYAAGFSIHFAEQHETYIDGMDYEAMGYKKADIPDTNRMFMAKTFTNTTTELPAIRWSAYLSGEHDRKIGETLVANSIPILEELLKDNSLLQLIKYLHAHPKQYEYVRRCQNEDERGICLNGYYGGIRTKENTCYSCKGTGKVLAASEQDVVTLAWAEKADDVYDLSKLSYYAERPIEILIQFREIVREAAANILQTTYNQQKIDPAQLTQAETATQTRIEFDKIYDRLSPFAELIALAWEKGQRTAYQHYGYVEVTANMTYPFDFKMKTILDLLVEYNAAKEAGAPYEVMQGLSMDILTKQNRNNPTKAADIAAFERWKPWKGKTPEEIALIIQSRDQNDKDRILWENWEQVVEEVKLDLNGLPFSKLPAIDQRADLYAAAEKISQGITYMSQPDPFTLPVPMDQPVDKIPN